MTATDPAAEAFGAIVFGIIGILYLVVVLFIIVLFVVFIFKAMGFMKRKTANDERLVLAVERIAQRLPSRDHHSHDE